MGTSSEMSTTEVYTRTPSVDDYTVRDHDLVIHKAAYNGDVPTLASLLASTPEDLEVRNSTGCTPLHLAIRKDHAEAVQLLLSAGADPTLEDEFNPALMQAADAIHLSASFNSREAMAILIDHGVPLPASVLCVAASLNHVDYVRTLLHIMFSREVEFSDASRLQGIRDALERAALCWHVDTVRILLSVDELPQAGRKEHQVALNNALINTVTFYDCDDGCRSGCTDWYWCYENQCVGQQKPHDRQFNTMRTLLEAGADVNAKRSGEKNTVLGCVLTTYRVPRGVILFLLQHGVDVVTSTGDRAPIFEIVSDSEDDPTIVEAFLVAGASAATVADKNTTLLHETTQSTIAEVLIRFGADVHARTETWETPLHSACTHESSGVATVLISHGAEVNATTVDGWTPLISIGAGPNTVSRGGPLERLQLANLLVEYGADVKSTTLSGHITSLHRAVEHHDAEMVAFLVEKRADVNARTVKSRSALHIACATPSSWGYASKSMVQIAQILIDNGAEIEAKDDTGATPLLLAVKSSHTGEVNVELINVLLDKGADRDAKDGGGMSVIEWMTQKEVNLNENGIVQNNAAAMWSFNLDEW
ncbi:ankyrin repeat-containing domain protein [Dendryphion nanum]|uniref:Ankyrin repeat-containing domain protein n=1 Tax=Dendryphion nanum TaxID=256645 RepID=A0A9P9DV19_9PLEO|nr:ankyrin repeat-containing domain protein [Dendryphion nanum]